ncbi:MAG: FecR domain-containing protein [Rikenellaceae bacterium]|nr:FecR domain-containing protein [Rikenellaceae bacterium]
MTATEGNTRSRELIEKFFEKRYPADVEKRFHLWLISDAGGEGEKEKALEDMWEATPCGSKWDAKGSLQQVRKKLGFPNPAVRPLRRKLAFRVAAVIIPFMVIAGGYILWNDRHTGNFTVQQVAYLEAVAGQRVVLPDNSVAEIKEGTLSYPAHFRGYERRVKLDGDAYFTVTGDASHPFIVEGNFLTVKVTGTQFMVTTDNELARATVSLVEGTVDVMMEGISPVSLSQGSELTYDSSTGDYTVAPLSEALRSREALAEGKLVFSDATLEQMLRAVARVHGLQVAIPSDLGGRTQYNVRFTGTETLEEKLDVLRLVSDGFNYQLIDGVIQIE